MSFVTGKIKHLDVPNRRGMIDFEGKNYPFWENWLKDLVYDNLLIGQSIFFQPFEKEGKWYAANVSPSNRVVSVVTTLYANKKMGFIKRLAENEPKDFYFNQKDTGEVPIENFTVGSTVEFEILEQDGKRYAKNVILLSQNEKNPHSVAPQNHSEKATSQNQNDDVDIPQFTKEIKQLLSKQIQQVAHLPFVFEDYAAFLLKLLGIPDVHPVPRANAGGMFDGLFKLQGVEIVYDCTLHSQFEDFKKEQIDNYINKIKQSSITINSRTVSLSAAATKQIWVITNGSRSRILQCVDDIYVKEICIMDLLNILEKRMNQSYTSLELASRLRELGQDNI